MKYLKSTAAIGVSALFCASSVSADYRFHTPNGAMPAVAAPTTVSGTNNGATCKVSFVTDNSIFTPPDDFTNLTSSPQSYRASAVSALKPCTGNVIAFFSSEIATPNSTSFIHAIARATCVATGGLSSPCTVGTVVQADPSGTTYMETNQAPNLATHSANFTFTQLARGQWRFEIDVGGDGAGHLDYRTLVVEMFGS